MARYVYDEDRGRCVGPDTELPVHGVGGTSPESLLYEHHPILVGGDEIAGFYRPQNQDQPTEAYAWGGLTARSSVRALWIVLLPFALVNVAGWMTPPGRDENDRHRFIEGLVRTIAVGSTVALTALSRRSRLTSSPFSVAGRQHAPDGVFGCDGCNRASSSTAQPG